MEHSHIIKRKYSSKWNTHQNGILILSKWNTHIVKGLRDIGTLRHPHEMEHSIKMEYSCLIHRSIDGVVLDPWIHLCTRSFSIPTTSQMDKGASCTSCFGFLLRMGISHGLNDLLSCSNMSSIKNIFSNIRVFFFDSRITPVPEIGLWTLSPRFSAVLPQPEPTISFLY